ncbi:MAG: arylsulfatase [Verrucomicrobiales bacterium]|nr:arylsulfatase [Verrucomicrobiales bacterium]MCP5525750.1 arylsulfatase [Verrucomicrobiales bacterium]
MRKALSLLSGLLAFGLVRGNAADSGTPDPRPNLLVILVDDMGWSDIGCYGSEIPTPHLDALAAGGLRFTQFYNTGRCSPTRASLLTGHYPHQAGMGHLDNQVKPGHPGFQGRLAATSVTIAEVLREAGYFTAMTGKWHLGQQHGTPPWERGFMRSLNLQAGGVHFAHQTGSKGGAKLYLNGAEKERTDPLFGDDWYGAFLWAEWGLNFIDEAHAEQKPFFLYLAHCAPHFPLMAPAEDIARYRGQYRVGWDRLREERHARQIAMGLVDPKWRLTPRAEDSPPWDSLTIGEQDRFDHIMAIYAAMIDCMDRSVGLVVEGLKRRGLLDNTLLLFLSDNGGNAESGPNGRYEGAFPGGPDSNVFLGKNWATLNNTPFRRWKHFVHEGGSAAPLIVHWPAGIPHERRGQLVHQPAHLIDVMATAVEVGGAVYPDEFRGHRIEPMEGVSLMPALAGNPLGRSQPLFFNHEDNRAVRDGRWKLVALKGKPWELYDMETDRTELNDLAAEQPERVRALAAAYRAWALRTHVVVRGVNRTGEPQERTAEASAE